MKIEKMYDHAYAQCAVLSDDTGVYLRSYNTIVCGIRNCYAFCNGTYSATTIKHIGYFCKHLAHMGVQYPFDYFTFKRLFRHNEVLDITTGELIARE